MEGNFSQMNLDGGSRGGGFVSGRGGFVSGRGGFVSGRGGGYGAGGGHSAGGYGGGGSSYASSHPSSHHSGGHHASGHHAGGHYTSGHHATDHHAPDHHAPGHHASSYHSTGYSARPERRRVEMTPELEKNLEIVQANCRLIEAFKSVFLSNLMYLCIPCKNEPEGSTSFCPVLGCHYMHHSGKSNCDKIAGDCTPECTKQHVSDEAYGKLMASAHKKA